MVFIGRARHIVQEIRERLENIRVREGIVCDGEISRLFIANPCRAVALKGRR